MSIDPKPKSSKDPLYEAWKGLEEGQTPENLSSLDLETTKEADEKNIQEFISLASEVEAE